MPRLEEEILYGTRAFPTTQEIFTGAPITTFFSNPVNCSWYGTEISPHRGAFCMVKEGTGHEELIGEFLRIQYRQRKPIVVYCLGETPEIGQPIALTRRAYNQLETLIVDPIKIYARVLR